MPYPSRSEIRPSFLAGGLGPWSQGIWCVRCGQFHSAPLNAIRKIDSVSLEELYNWDGKYG